MKKYAIKLYIVVVFASAILAPIFIYHLSVKNLHSATAQMGRSENRDQEKSIPVATGDSFIAGKAFGKDRGRLDSLEAKVSRGKAYLLTQVGNRLKQLGPFRTRIQNLGILSDSERESLVTELNAIIDRFESFKPAIHKSATGEDIKNVADQIKAEWIKSREGVESVEKRIIAMKESQLLADADENVSNLQNRIANLKTSGKDTKVHEKLLTNFSRKINNAKLDVDAAKQQFDEAAGASNETQKHTLMKKKEILLSSARDSIKGAYKLVGDEARREFSQRFK